MDLKQLRQATAEEHSATEETVPLMRETLTRADYCDCLRRFYRAVQAWDTWADAHVPVDLLELFRGRRRATLIEDDLRYLGESTPVTESFSALDEAIAGDPRSVFLGRMYVMEGSTLGGQYIAQHVEERLGLQHGEGDSYFVGYGEATSRRWQEFRAVLLELPETEAETVIHSAKQMFAIFRDTMS